jgi:Na+/proline symporter
MSGMAGNVTAFNTVWTYDIYQSYIRQDADDEHYLWMGRMATIVGIAISILTAYVAARFQQDHGLATTGVFHRERAFACHVSARHVLRT